MRDERPRLFNSAFQRLFNARRCGRNAYDPEMRFKSSSRLRLACMGLLLAVSAVHAAVHPRFDVNPAQDVLARLLGDRATQFELGPLEARGGHERFRISNANGRIRVEGTTPSALLFGVNWYLKYIAHVQISTNGTRLGPSRKWPLPAAAIERETPYA
jgi:alpha-N-acetylglucosaminidase